MRTTSPIIAALDRDSYDWLSTAAPELLDAIESEVAAGRTPEAVGRMVAAHVGAERSALAIRCQQAAAYIARSNA